LKKPVAGQDAGEINDGFHHPVMHSFPDCDVKVFSAA
jgi:hypothetical protein